MNLPQSGWWECRIKVNPDSAELCSAALLEAGCSGVWVQDSDFVDDGENAQLAARAEATVTGYLTESSLDEAACRAKVQPALDGYNIAGHIECEWMPAQDWAENWRENFPPLKAGPFLVTAPWHEIEIENSISVCIDPGLAFGTGQHPTTHLCLELLAQCYKSTFPEASHAKMENVKALAPEYYEHFLADMKLERTDDYDYVVAQYDGEISYADAQVGRLLESLETNNLMDDTIVIAMSDHGECFGEGDFYFDHHGLYDATTKVALMCHVPGAIAGRCEQMVSTQDIFPTLCAQMNWQTPPDISSHYQFAQAFNNQPFNLRDEIILVESSRQASIAIRTADWKLILPVTEDINGNGLPDFYGNQRDPKVLLYDLINDPNETQNVADHNPSQRDRLLHRLQAWRAREVARLDGHDPLLENGLSLGYEEFMERMVRRAK